MERGKMIRVKTATGKEFESDFVGVSESPPRLYADIINSSLEEVVTTVMKQGELPLQGYEGFRTIDNIINGRNRVSLTLRP